MRIRSGIVAVAVGLSILAGFSKLEVAPGPSRANHQSPEASESASKTVVPNNRRIYALMNQRAEALRREVNSSRPDRPRMRRLERELARLATLLR